MSNTRSANRFFGLIFPLFTSSLHSSISIALRFWQWVYCCSWLPSIRCNASGHDFFIITNINIIKTRRFRKYNFLLSKFRYSDPTKINTSDFNPLRNESTMQRIPWTIQEQKTLWLQWSVSKIGLNLNRISVSYKLHLRKCNCFA